MGVWAFGPYGPLGTLGVYFLGKSEGERQGLCLFLNTCDLAGSQGSSFSSFGGGSSDGGGGSGGSW